MEISRDPTAMNKIPIKIPLDRAPNDFASVNILDKHFTGNFVNQLSPALLVFSTFRECALITNIYSKQKTELPT